MTEAEMQKYLVRTGLQARAQTLNAERPVKPVRYIDQVGIDMTRGAGVTLAPSQDDLDWAGYIRNEGVVADHRWTIFLETKLKSQNAFKHWRARHAEMKHFMVVVHHALLEQGFRVATASATRQRLTITRHLGLRERLYDEHNGGGGSVKQLQDAVKRLGWMTDDSPRWLEGVFIQDDSRRDRPGTTVTLERLRLERTKS